MPYNQEVGWIDEISSNGKDASSIEWQIRNIMSLPGGSEDVFCSPEFRLVNERWCLRLWPKWMNDSWNPASGWIRIALLRIAGDSSKIFRIRVGIKVPAGITRESEVERVITRFGTHDWSEFCSRFMLIEQKSMLMADNILKIVCSIKLLTPGRVAGDGELFTKGKFAGSAGTSVIGSRLQGMEVTLEDFGKLLTSGEYSDVTVRVGDVDFKVHRLILSARSPVFSAMFRHETAERTSNKITIDDCEPEVFKEYLNFLYTGFIGALSQQHAFSLYQVADKYLADNLKRQCLKQILDGMSAQTFGDAVQLAMVYGEDELFERAIAFASENIFLNSFYFKQNALLQ